FFVFPDLGVKRPGVFRIQFVLYQRAGQTLRQLGTVTSDPFVVYSTKMFPGVLESTALSRMFVNQGVKIRLRNGHQ
ncbi:velvet factor, partial [Thamnocephalis sphaerospora]